MALAQEYSINAVTVGSTELSIISGTTTLQTNTTKGIRGLFLDASNMAKGDEYEVRIYDKVISTGTKRLAYRQTLSDAQSEIIVFPDLFLYNGWDMTIKKNAGTDRTFTASIRATTGSGLTEAYTQSALSTSTTETSLTNGTTTLASQTTAGKYQLWLDVSNLAFSGGDDLVINVYETAISGGTQRRIYQAYLYDTQPELFFTPVFTLLNGWEMTVTRVAGVARTIDASIRRVG